MVTNNDQDILDSLREIDEDQILGEEVVFDKDLDFELEGDTPAVVKNSPEAAEESSPPAPVVRPAKPAPENKRKAKKGESKVVEVCTVPEKVIVETAETEVGEIVLRAKTIRIIADKVVIEPKDISISP